MKMEKFLKNLIYKNGNLEGEYLYSLQQYGIFGLKIIIKINALWC